MDIVRTVNGMTGDVILGAEDIAPTPSSSMTIDDLVSSAWTAEATAISDREDEYLLTLTKRS